MVNHGACYTASVQGGYMPGRYPHRRKGRKESMFKIIAFYINNNNNITIINKNYFKTQNMIITT